MSTQAKTENTEPSGELSLLKKEAKLPWWFNEKAAQEQVFAKVGRQSVRIGSLIQMYFCASDIEGMPAMTIWVLWLKDDVLRFYGHGAKDNDLFNLCVLHDVEPLVYGEMALPDEFAETIYFSSGNIKK